MRKLTPMPLSSSTRVVFDSSSADILLVLDSGAAHNSFTLHEFELRRLYWYMVQQKGEDWLNCDGE